MAKKQPTNIEVYRKKWSMNIGIVIFGAIFIYLLVTVLVYLTSKHVSVYEVREGSILKDNAYTGMAIREEKIITSEEEGYVNYIVAEGEKVGRKTNIYSLSPNELTFNQEEAEEVSSELTAEEENAILLKMQSFQDGYQNEQFSDTYILKEAVENIISDNTSQSKQSQLNTMLESGQEGLVVFSAVDDGIVQYAIDGYEGVTLDQVTENMISKIDYQKQELFNNAKVKAQDPLYKLITSETWSIAILLDDNVAKEMVDIEQVKVNFSKDGQSTWADFSIFNTKDANMGILTFDHSVVRYAGDRYLDIELILEDETGLKVPKSAKTTKEFALVPKDYLTQGGNTKETGVLVSTGGGAAKFKKVEVYYQDAETKMVYLDPNTFKEKDILLKPDSEETYSLEKRESLAGVYNINKGYALFRQIHILCESEEYYIVEAGNPYGLTNYDHIALDGKSLRENDVVFK